MLGRMPKGRAAGWHDVGGRVDPPPCPHGLTQNLVIVLELVVLEGDLTEGVLKQLPSVNLIEQFEEQSTEQHFGR